MLRESMPFHRYPLFSRFILFVFIPILALTILLWNYAQSSISPSSGSIEINGLINPVNIKHDSFGTPFINAKTDHDAYFAIGFKHASDRLWQMELQRRLAQGRLSEIFGTDSISTDIWLRTLGFQQAAEQAWQHLSPNAKEALDAYRDGVNAYILQSPSLPPEFQVLQVNPELWSVYDSLSWQKMFALNLNRNLFDEINRFIMKSRFSAEQIQTFFPYDPLIELGSQVPETASVTSLLSSLSFQLNPLQDQWGIGHRFAGSNAWVVAGEHTKSGKPILANDPHLGLQIPSLWYSVSMKGDKLNVAGMSLVGLPTVIFGQNTNVSWGGTSLESDQQDLFIETVSNSNPDQYLSGSGWKPFQLREEVIQVKAPMPSSLRTKLEPVTITVRSTDIGPVISDIFNESDKILSLRWAALDQKDLTFEAFFNLQYASNWQEFRTALSLIKAPGLNFLYADHQGNIGAQAAGKMPNRGAGVGILPQSSQPISNLWQGYADFDLMPSILNPEQGYLVSANEKISHSEDLVISHEWAPPARKKRIENLLLSSIESGKPISLAATQATQIDQVDISTLPLIPLLTRVKPETDLEKEAISALKLWSGEYSVNSVAASIFHTWVDHLRKEIFSNELKHSWQRPEQANRVERMENRVTHQQLTEILKSDRLGWCSNNNESRPCQQELITSLKESIKQLKKLTSSSDLDNWRWGDLHRTEFSHRPFSDIRGLKSFFTRTTHVGGSPNTINAANAELDWSRGFIQNFGAGFRQVFQLDEMKTHLYMNSTGQSGHFMSSYYDDMIEPFSQGQLSSMSLDLTDAPILILSPNNGSQ